MTRRTIDELATVSSTRTAPSSRRIAKMAASSVWHGGARRGLQRPEFIEDNDIKHRHLMRDPRRIVVYDHHCRRPRARGPRD